MNLQGILTATRPGKSWRYLLIFIKWGKTVILVTHETDVANYANRHVVLSDGHISKDFKGRLL